ncbi:hypothetical protein KP001_08985 [Geomonas subterranea]|uniref:Nucleoside phosphorylase domain-containing protein n=1 Tax=Geomonas subterranea TaxID=2847989 RepID=A0ABX8LL73_9BACT|nr:hypothetical protein [Geomonas subterranea]QXE92632.1 hypothetical protein KP001_08985 [Geomonas subterranea]QXM09269.1 hypothetical protein KP002_20290 [Geomonas subterranea]
MKVLILDDQYSKVETFCRVLNKLTPCKIDHVSNSKDALKYLYDNSDVDLLIVDLQIPEVLGGDVLVDGGVKFLEYIELNTSYQLPKHVVGATAYAESYCEYKEYFENRGWRLVQGTESETFFESLFSTIINYTRKEFQKFDIAIITALRKTEFEAILSLLHDLSKVQFKNDSNIYYIGSITISSGEIKSVIATSCPRMGIAAATALSTRILLRHNPEYIIMTGIAAGIKGKVKLGDILVAEPSWEWGSGKLTVREGKPTFLSSPHQLHIHSNLSPILSDLSAQRTYLDEIQHSAKELGLECSNQLNMHVGPVASGAVVLEEPETVELIKAQNRDTIGIDMEAYGVMASANYAYSNPTNSIVIKSVCDFANIDKNDDLQPYAAFTSAAFAIKLIQNHLFN